jgi:18S rRNA (guanine1575-N7)-methyltransferase
MPPDEPSFLLDIGCGSGLSGEILDEEGYIWAGVDIAPSMLGEHVRIWGAEVDKYAHVYFMSIEVALEREVEGDLFLQDIGQGFGFRPGSFDGAIRSVTLLFIPQIHHSIKSSPCSISVLQWLLNAETSHPTSSPPHRLSRFFTTLHSALRNSSRAVFQFYPSSDDQIQLITSAAQKAGFGGGVVVDYPNSNKAKKVFLVLFVGGGGGSGHQQMPEGLQGEKREDGKVRFERRREREAKREKGGKRKGVKDKDWILKKKEVRIGIHSSSSKYTC